MKAKIKAEDMDNAGCIALMFAVFKREITRAALLKCKVHVPRRRDCKQGGSAK